MSNETYEYDIAISYASEDRSYAEALADILLNRGVHVFYDKYEKAVLWGKDLYTYLSDLYQNKSRYCILFISKHYAAKLWTKHELKSAQARALREQDAYILPLRLDETEIPGILPTTAYLTWERETIESIANAILTKLGILSRKSITGWLKESREYSDKGLFEKARIACSQAIRIDPFNSDSYTSYSWILHKLERHEEALSASEQAIRFDLQDDFHYTLDLYRNKGSMLEALKRYEEALAVYEQVIQLGKAKQAAFLIFYDYDCYYGDLCDKGDALRALERYEEALAAYDQAIMCSLLKINYPGTHRLL